MRAQLTRERVFPAPRETLEEVVAVVIQTVREKFICRRCGRITHPPASFSPRAAPLTGLRNSLLGDRKSGIACDRREMRACRRRVSARTEPSRLRPAFGEGGI